MSSGDFAKEYLEYLKGGLGNQVHGNCADCKLMPTLKLNKQRYIPENSKVEERCSL